MTDLSTEDCGEHAENARKPIPQPNLLDRLYDIQLCSVSYAHEFGRYENFTSS
jgi:hypothetical protein